MTYGTKQANPCSDCDDGYCVMNCGPVVHRKPQYAWIKRVGTRFMVLAESSVMPGHYHTMPNGSTSPKAAAKYATGQGFTVCEGECPLPRMNAARPVRVDEPTKDQLRTLMKGRN